MTLIVELMLVDFDDRPADAPGFGIPADVIPLGEFRNGEFLGAGNVGVWREVATQGVRGAVLSC